MRILLFLVGLVSATQLNAQAGRNVAKYNLVQGLGLKGFDPVSYFPEGGGSPRVGSSAVEVSYKGVVYRFANEVNKTTFLGDPEKYEPTYGGWCAYAMATGSQVDIQPDIFTIHARRSHFFVSRRAKRNFDDDVIDYESNADGEWFKISGEEPRN